METKVIDKIEIKKDLYRTKAIAKLLYYEPSNGDLMYTVYALGKDWIFPIHTIQPTTKEIKIQKFDEGVSLNLSVASVKITDDLKGARWEPEIKGSSLIRWIEQAIDKNEFH